jgi:hypothetical protein
MPHTPGPWYVARMGNDHQGLVIAEGSGANVAVTYDKADAPLVALAPEMLDSLSELAEVLDTMLLWYGPKPDRQHVMRPMSREQYEERRNKLRTARQILSMVRD